MSWVACKHGHIDGALHRTCPRCQTEYWQEQAEQMKVALRQITDAAEKRAGAEDIGRIARLALIGIVIDHEKVKQKRSGSVSKPEA